MSSYVIHITCNCGDHELANVFNFLDRIIKKKECLPKALRAFYPFQTEIVVVPEARRPDRWFMVGISQAEKISPAQMEDLDLEHASILLTVHIENDGSSDVFSYRYLFLTINHLLREQDMVSLDCSNAYYHKIASYFILQVLSSKCVIFHQETGKALARKFRLSFEWFPAVYLSEEHNELYEILANPLFDNTADLAAALNETSSEKINYTPQAVGRRDLKSLYRKYLQICFARWIGSDLRGSALGRRLNNVPGMAQLLFALMFRNYSITAQKGRGRQQKPRWEENKLDRLLEICCDFSDCILQVAENIVSHTKGGELVIRFNNNWNKLQDTFRFEPAPSKNDWYMRISLTDYSQAGILDTVKSKLGVDGLSLSDIFNQGPSVGPEDGSGQIGKTPAAEYQKKLNESEHIIHHYGLAVFKNTVQQYHGYFIVNSSADAVGGSAPFRDGSEEISYVCEAGMAHIPGTEYDILLPLRETILNSEGSECRPSLLLTPQYIIDPPARGVVFQEGICDFFGKPLSNLILQNTKQFQKRHQALKEFIAAKAAETLADQMIAASDGGRIENHVFYFYLSDLTEQVFGRTEIAAKIILQTIAVLKKRGQNNMYALLYGLSEERILHFARQFALFYHRDGGNQLMSGCQVLAVSKEYQAEVLFAGSKLSSIADYSKSRRLVTGASANMSKLLDHIASRDRTGAALPHEQGLVPFPFDLLNRMEQVKTPKGTQVVCSAHNKWYIRNLASVLCSDVHEENLGCRMKNVHVSAGGIHLNRFYEGQLLFGNAYWYQVFSHYICEQVLSDEKIQGTDILLYGYETYSEQMLFAAKQKLEKRQDHAVGYVLFENPKYIATAEKSEKRVRYIDDFCKNCGKKLSIIYIFGIGTTLRTMSEQLDSELKAAFQNAGKSEVYENAYKKGLVVVQVAPKKNRADRQVMLNRRSHIVRSSQGYLDFLPKQACHYLIEVKAKWRAAEDCPYCFQAPNYLDELPLIQTNETSTVPMILIKPVHRSDVKICYRQEETFARSFLENDENEKYLYYSHLNRSGNHYQFYIRTAALFRDFLQDEHSGLLAWFKSIRELEELDAPAGAASNCVNIIVSPLHFSNESFVAAVNQYVFGGAAYIINFDVKKEFRDSFIAKFQNYYSALRLMENHRDDPSRSSGEDYHLKLNFYFVDDIILTGSTFNRAKSLTSSMLGEYFRNHKKNRDVSVNLFKGIILLVNRNSKETLSSFFDVRGLSQNLGKGDNAPLELPVYRFIELNTPAIRSYGDSCPLCNKMERIRKLEEEAALTFAAHHWQDKAEYHKLKKLSEAKNDKRRQNDVHEGDTNYKNRGFRRLQCSETIWGLVKRNILNRENVMEVLEQEINQFLSRRENKAEKTEYLISFLKVISREHLVYQELVQIAALKILLSILSIFLNDKMVERKGLYQTVYDLIYQADNPQYPYMLYQLVIARLSAMGSVVFCRREQLEGCLDVGLRLEKECKDTEPDRRKPERFCDFLCIQLQKMLFSTANWAVRINKFQEILKDCINDELVHGEDNKERLEFFSAMYLECVCDNTRGRFLAPRGGRVEAPGYGAADDGATLEGFQKRIESDSYELLLDAVRQRMGAQMAVMFQSRDQGRLTEKLTGRDITILASAKSAEEIGILRSELLDFFRNDAGASGGKLNRPAGRLLLDIKDTVRIVQVAEEQRDPVVQRYRRSKCTIAYVRMDYRDSFNKTDGMVFFAFFYAGEQVDILSLLDSLQGFLSFRHSLTRRIEKDFNGNLYGRQKEEEWHNSWLSMEKAGSHTDSSGVSRLVSKAAFKSNPNILSILFSKSPDGNSAKHARSLFQLVQNIYIAMYFRAAISEHNPVPFIDNVVEKEDGSEPRYCFLKDLVQLDVLADSNIRAGRGQDFRQIDSLPLYREFSESGGEEDVSTGGIPVPKAITFRSKYLKAFLVDILCNMEKYGVPGAVKEIYVEESEEGPRRLVFRNEVRLKGRANAEECEKQNYRLKQSLEFDQVDQEAQKGISLGCIAHFVQWSGGLMSAYTFEDEKPYFTIKLPIIQQEEDNTDG